MIALDDYQALQRKVQKLQQERDKAAGALEQLLRQLQKEFGHRDLKAAKKALEQMKDKEQQAYQKYVKAKAAFEKQWKDVLE